MEEPPRPIEPTDYFFKTKKSATLFSGLLLVASWVGVSTGEDGSLHLLPIELSNPGAIPTILCFIVIYYVIQISLSWFSQISLVRSNIIFLVDYAFVVTICFSSILSFIFLSVGVQDYISDIDFGLASNWSSIITLASALVGFISVVYGSYLTIKTNRKSEIRREENLGSALVDGIWYILFNPAANKGKYIRFLPDGTIDPELGGNKNESRWRLREGFLEILSREDRVFSRFSYKNGEFIHTNDGDTISIRNQKIFRRDE